MNQYSNSQLIADMRKHPSCSREDNDRLYALVKQGDPQAREEMILGNMYLVVEKVDCFIRRHSNAAHLRDDLTSAGFTGLLLAVNAVAGGSVENDNITGYLAVGIGNALVGLMDSENTIHISFQQRGRAREQGCELEVPVVQPLPSNEDHSDDLNDDGGAANQETQPLSGDQSYDPMSMPDLRDLLESCCQTDTDRAFIQMREASYTYREIAAALSMPLVAVKRMSAAIYERFLQKSGLPRK